jgi:UDP:flavonoid glycosyltransferase YjiC (YdhE family)
MGNPNAMPLDLPGQPLVVPFAPHQQLIAGSALVITHAGLNTTLTALGCGVPLLAIPITNEQPGIAARVAYCRAGLVLPLRKLCVERLTAMAFEVLHNPIYRENARRLGREIQAAGGVSMAADLIEACLPGSSNAT